MSKTLVYVVVENWHHADGEVLGVFKDLDKAKSAARDAMLRRSKETPQGWGYNHPFKVDEKMMQITCDGVKVWSYRIWSDFIS